MATIIQDTATIPGLLTKNILVVGATGFLGSAVSRNFLDAGCKVKCFVRNKDRAGELIDKGAEIIVGNLTDSVSIKDACKNIDVVITAAHAMLGKL